MACKYIYKGKEFTSELALDDFLLERLPFEPTLGDMVFSSYTTALLNVANQLSKIAKESVRVKKIMRDAINSGKVIYDDDGNMAVEDPPYIGVNKFLSGLRNEAGQLLFPEFIEDEYWKRRYMNWKIGQFTDAEIEEFQLDKNNLPKITNPDLQKELRKLMTNKWQIQAKTGTAIHNILQICYQKNNGVYNFELNDAELTNVINQKLESKNKQFITPKVIQLTIKYAKKLNKDLTLKFGEGCAYYPEFVVTLDTNIIHKGTPTKLMGIIDLLIIDSEGKPHILDYKTSIHDYSDFGIAKRTAYTYLLATYQRMLLKYGMNTYQGTLLVSPIKIDNFRKEGDTYIYDGIKANESFAVLNTSLNSDKLWANIDEFMPAPFKLSITTNDFLLTDAKMMGEWFPVYSSMLKITRELIIERLKKWKKLTPDENGQYTYRKFGKEAPIVSTDENDFIDKVLKYELSRTPNTIRLTGDLKSNLKQAINQGIENVEFPSPITSESGSSATWLKDILSLYCNGSWEVVDNELLESFGVITVKTKGEPRLVDFIRVSTNDLYTDYRRNYGKKLTKVFQGRKGLLSTYEADVVQKSKSDNLVPNALLGNVELMEMMLLINLMNNLGGCTVGNVFVVNPRYANGITLSNEELLYCWKELNKHSAITLDNISNGAIQFASKYEIARSKFNNIMRQGAERGWRDGYLAFTLLIGCQNILDENVDGTVDDKINALNKLLVELDRHFEKLKRTYRTEAELLSKEVALYNAILTAILDLKGIRFKLQPKDHSKIFDSIFIWKDGFTGTYFNNPGNQDSDTLNLISKLVTEAYLNVRDDLLNEKVTIAKMVRDLKSEANFGKLQENTVGNLVSLYKNMFREYTEGGDFLFKNPNQLVGAEKTLLEHVLLKINKNRFPGKTDEELELMRDTDDIEYYQVPLAMGGQDSVASTWGLLAVFKNKCRLLLPKEALERARRKMEGIFNAEEELGNQQTNEVSYRMTNLFDKGQDITKRLDKIKEIGIENLEHNIEILLYKHLYAYSVQRNVDAVFPMIKAAMVHLCTLGAILNNPFTQDISYFQNYIKNKIFNLVIIDPKLKELAHFTGLLKQSASKLTLAFAPVQALYQSLQGLWNDISLIIRKPDGKESFTIDHFKKSLKIVYSDLAHFSDKPTLCSAINELYGNNDMDMNTYIERISQGKKGIWNMDNFAYKFASRPDFYNRMSIFVCLMMGDGCWDAHFLDKDGRLIYDWKKDKRFEAFANGRTSDPKYNEHKTRYYTIARQFALEHTKYLNPKTGKLEEFKVNMNDPIPLPRAYTNKEAESMKSLADHIYGYYSHEKKSLIMSTFLGSMWLQFKTYWSSKKDQYFQSGGVYLRGKWEHYEENGLKYYYQVDENGNVLFDEPPTTKETSAPFLQWKGQWQEGIIVTLADIARNSWNSGLIDNKGIHLSALKAGWDSKWNIEDENLQLAYRNNVKLFVYDLMMLILGGGIISALLGDWLDDLKDPKNKDLSTGLAIAAANIAVMSVRNSFLDFNTWDSIGGAIYGWTPFSFEWTTRTLKNVMSVATGDTDIWDGIVNTSGGLKQIKPVMDAIKPDMFRTKREGGTFGKDE